MFEGGYRLKKLAIHRALRKKSPRRITYSQEGTHKIDCFTTFLRNESENDLDMIVDDMDDTKIRGFQLEGQSYSQEKELEISELYKCDLTIIHYLRHAQTKYDSALDFWYGQVTLLPQRFLIKQSIIQWFRVKTTRFRHDRMDVLKTLVQKNLECARGEGMFAEHGEAQSYLGLFESMYGTEVFAHPKHDKELKRFRFILDSLVEGGELSQNNGRYELKGRALSTIADYEEAERRHSDSVRQNRRLVWLTLLIAVATLLQAYSAFFKS